MFFCRYFLKASLKRPFNQHFDRIQIKCTKYPCKQNFSLFGSLRTELQAPFFGSPLTILFPFYQKLLFHIDPSGLRYKSPYLVGPLSDHLEAVLLVQPKHSLSVSCSSSNERSTYNRVSQFNQKGMDTSTNSCYS